MEEKFNNRNARVYAYSSPKAADLIAMVECGYHSTTEMVWCDVGFSTVPQIHFIRTRPILTQH